MATNDFRLKGHESFILREGWITKGLTAIKQDEKVFTKSYGADALGVGTNMAKSIRYWLRTSGLTRETTKGVYLTELGELIYTYDRYLEDSFTLWILHCQIAQNYTLATTWNLFFNQVGASRFTRDELVTLMSNLLINITGEAQPERSVRDDCSALLQMYCAAKAPKDIADPEEKRVSPFAILGLISEQSGGIYEKTRPAFALIDPLIVMALMSNKLNTDGSIQIDDVATGENMPGRLLNLNRIAVNDYLDTLQNNGYLIVNRTAGLDVVYPAKSVTSIELYKEHYERSTKQ